MNIGAGTVTCNYDGIQKNSTVIGDDVFIGAGTMLIAPINISSNSRTGAGSVVNSDVDKNQTVVGIPAKPIKLKKSTRYLFGISPSNFLHKRMASSRVIWPLRIS